MTVLERKRKRLIHALMHDTDENRMLQIEKLYFDESPLCYSVEELQESLIEVERDFAEGNGISSEELRKQYVGV